jgi:glycosidase
MANISRAFRDKLGVDELLSGSSGNNIFGSVTASRRLAQRLNELRGPGADPEGAVNGGALYAMGLIDELNHALVARYRKEIDPPVLAEAVRWFAALADPAKVEALLHAWADQFPNDAVYRGDVTAGEWLEGATEGLANREAALEELLLLWIANINPAFQPFRELFEDTGLKQETIYQRVSQTFPDYFSTRPLVDPEVGTLFDALQAPMLAFPDSLTGQLDFIREHWSKHLGEDLRRVLLAIDTLREEDIAVWMRFHPAGSDRFEQHGGGWSHEGFVGDKYVGFDQDFVVGADGVRHRRYAEDYQAPLNEYEAFSADQAWMPNVVLMAKSTYVWLEQLSKKYGRHIHRLDQIPDEELELLAQRGITGLWLIGLWERSTASRTIKRLRGHADAVASAYSLKGYDIAEDLGGVAGYEHLKHRAAAAGLRLASDMVPNHMGIDSDWVIEHPEWFLSRLESPFPSYRFDGPNLSNDGRVEIKIEDHYYEQTDAAVVFRLRHHRDGSTRYMYHGNDGTTFAWNDTAQIDYSKAEVREHVIQTILHVARLFPIIRFDAAMVLAKRHVQRLWFPLPGAGGSIPSRAENAMSQEEFEALMPHEFWREVVDRVAVEVPGTLLLAEAFWLLEGYFVRTLGMHRVYNSAFMNMMRDEENAKYRSYLKETIKFDPDIMKRYVNFMSNPDERTAIDQFGAGDKYFGVATLLATLPGLPMFGHGQIEGFTERYGMEFKQAKMDERPNESLSARHQHELAPLLKNRRIFAESENFTLYDFWLGEGSVDENVFAYSNRLGNERSIILYNNRYESTRGTIQTSVGSMDKGSGSLLQRSLAEGLGLPNDKGVIVAYRDTKQNLEYLRRASDIRAHGLSMELRGYQCVVLLNWRELQSTAEYPWDRLCDDLRGGGVEDLHAALTMLRLRPLHDALRVALSSDAVGSVAQGALEQPKAIAVQGAEVKAAEVKAARLAPVAVPAPVTQVAAEQTSELDAVVEKGQWFFDRVMENLPAGVRKGMEGSIPWGAGEAGVPVDAPELSFRDSLRALTEAAGRLEGMRATLAKSWTASAQRALPGQAGGAGGTTWAPVLAWMMLRSIPGQEQRVRLVRELNLQKVLGEIFAGLGMQGDAQWRAAARVRLLLAYEGSEGFWTDPDARWLIGVHEWEGKTYFRQEGFEELVGWMQIPALLAGGTEPGAMRAVVEGAASACRRAKAAGYNLRIYLAGAAERPRVVPVVRR